MKLSLIQDKVDASGQYSMMVFNQLQKVEYSEYERLNFKYGAIRKINNPQGVFDSKDKELYKEIAKFTIEYCQNELVTTFGLK